MVVFNQFLADTAHGHALSGFDGDFPTQAMEAGFADLAQLIPEVNQIVRRTSHPLPVIRFLEGNEFVDVGDLVFMRSTVALAVLLELTCHEAPLSWVTIRVWLMEKNS